MKEKFTAIVFFKDKTFVKYRNIENIVSFQKYLFKNYKKLKYIDYRDQTSNLELHTIHFK
jgi:hypothetical protein